VKDPPIAGRADRVAPPPPGGILNIFAVQGAPPGWNWDDRFTLVTEAVKKQQPAPEYLTMVTVHCGARGCSRTVGRVEVPRDNEHRPVWVTWMEGQEPDTYWLGRYSLVQGQKRAPDGMRFWGFCRTHSSMTIRLADLWAALATHRVIRVAAIAP
jgi:hypothetical protein